MNITCEISDFLSTDTPFISGKNVTSIIEDYTNLPSNAICITVNGKKVNTNLYYTQGTVRICGTLLGGKGGFGSMLRAIGAQIEKTTNREACRDLSGRRLRDINEEQRLKNWLAQQKDREVEKEEKKKKKIEKLLETPKHEFKDDVYQKERSNLTDKIYDSLTQGLKRKQVDGPSTSSSGTSKSVTNKKQRKRILLDEELDAINDTDDDSDDEKAIALAT